ncbi:hypothetical protein P22_2640 [Propionispora sp. 2/2-37]|uniref:YqaA family protein n=1 Tax=Propionispora sp. 2/2-37 TaxID=1677858 RepID=UPI0006BB7BE8|nr:VTT domain-containing protein [Propionispora sp. 2/2-37]CUH96550.1 hypothetical protein P22_2640 [Propionispora sp. 2/2-37]
MDQILQFLEGYGIWGLFLLSFLESFISPILPDVMLIPMVLAEPSQALYYSTVATAASVGGGFIGYGIGSRFGTLALHKFVPPRHSKKIENWFTKYGGWAIFLASLAPIPYKFVSISAGTFRTNLLVFFLASILGRGKRFLLIGIIVHYLGPEALQLFQQIPTHWILAGIALCAAVVALYYYYKKQKNIPEKQPD